MDLKDQLLGIERDLWKNDPVLYGDHLTENAVLVFPETGVISRDFAVEAIHKEHAEHRRWAEVRFRDVRCMPLGEDSALLTYRVTSRWEREDDEIHALASSVYVKRGRDWKLAFHQQTPATES